MTIKYKKIESNGDVIMGYDYDKEYSDKELLLYEKTDALWTYVDPMIKNFPTYETYGLKLHIDSAFCDMLTAISRGNRVKSLRMRLLQEADGYLSTIRVLFAQTERRRYLSKAQHDDIKERLSEIGKLLFGYIKATAKEK